jgi:signal transduction histidine kinase
MSNQPQDEVSPKSLASSLAAHRQRILNTYEQQLAENNCPLALDEMTMREVMAQAADTFDEVIANLGSDDRVQSNPGPLLSRQIGIARASRGIHPIESVQAAGEFFTAFIKDIFTCLGIDENSPIVSATLTLHRSITTRVSETGAAYSGFLLDKINRVQIDERKLLARDLHDNVGSAISSCYRQLELLSIIREDDPGDMDAIEIRIESAKQALMQSMYHIQQLTADLRLVEPLRILEKTLRDFVDSAEEVGIDTSIIVHGDEHWASDRVRDEVFLVVREAMRNSMRHSRPCHVYANVNIAPHELRASVQDDGCGFRVDDVAPGRSGLRSMRERVELLGGNFRLSSTVGQGTSVTISIPLEGALIS